MRPFLPSLDLQTHSDPSSSPPSSAHRGRRRQIRHPLQGLRQPAERPAVRASDDFDTRLRGPAGAAGGALCPQEGSAARLPGAGAQAVVGLEDLLVRPFPRSLEEVRKADPYSFLGCRYSDRPSGDWLIDYHPAHPSLFVAAGCCGHAFSAQTLPRPCLTRTATIYTDDLHASPHPLSVQSTCQSSATSFAHRSRARSLQRRRPSGPTTTPSRAGRTPRGRSASSRCCRPASPPTCRLARDLDAPASLPSVRAEAGASVERVGHGDLARSPLRKRPCSARREERQAAQILRGRGGEGRVSWILGARLPATRPNVRPSGPSQRPSPCSPPCTRSRQRRRHGGPTRLPGARKSRSVGRTLALRRARPRPPRVVPRARRARAVRGVRRAHWRRRRAGRVPAARGGRRAHWRWRRAGRVPAARGGCRARWPAGRRASACPATRDAAAATATGARAWAGGRPRTAWRGGAGNAERRASAFRRGCRTPLSRERCGRTWRVPSS